MKKDHTTGAIQLSIPLENILYIPQKTFLSILQNTFLSIPQNTLLSTVKAANFDNDSYLRQMVPKNLKNCRSFKAQERRPLSKAFKSKIYFEMPEKIKDGCYSFFSSLFVMLVLACRS
jgi:hypothetical protein